MGDQSILQAQPYFVFFLFGSYLNWIVLSFGSSLFSSNELFDSKGFATPGSDLVGFTRMFSGGLPAGGTPVVGVYSFFSISSAGLSSFVGASSSFSDYLF